MSEAHAMVSLRGSALKLLALRGRFAVDDKPLQEVELRAGLVVWLASDLSLEVVDVVLPGRVLAIEGDGLARHVLGGVSTLHVEPRPALIPGFASDGAAVVWHDGADWMLRVAGGEDCPLEAGDSWQIGGATFRAVSVAVTDAGHSTTRALGGIDRPLTLVVRYDSAHVQREGEPVVVLSGISARILSELAIIGLPIAWEALAADLWPGEVDATAQRRKWDASLARLRQKLREGRVRGDLVRADGNGNFELYLHQTDRVEDQT
ncbi:MAG: hypothetical protein R3F39_11525 [Myxococcota bacterium]